VRTCGFCGRQERPSTTCTTSVTLSHAAEKIEEALKATETALGLFSGEMMPISVLGMIADDLAAGKQIIDGMVDRLGDRR
jgi:hypothetical protein